MIVATGSIQYRIAGIKCSVNKATGWSPGLMRQTCSVRFRLLLLTLTDSLTMLLFVSQQLIRHRTETYHVI